MRKKTPAMRKALMPISADSGNARRVSRKAGHENQAARPPIISAPKPRIGPGTRPIAPGANPPEAVIVARRSGWENSDNQDGNRGSRCWHDCHSVTVAQGGLRICIVAARRSGIGRGCRVDRRAAAASLAFERGATAVALDVHLEDGGMMNQAVDDRDRHCLVREDLAPFAEGLVGGDEEGSPLVAGADELKEHAGFGLVFGDVGDVIEDQQMEFVELGNSGFESELATGNLQSLDKIGGSGEHHAPAVFDESQAESCRKVALAAARWPKQQ